MNWELLSFIKRSKQRVNVLTAFGSVHTPSEIAKATSLAPSHISRTLKEFCTMGLLDCINPKAKTGKLYKLTKEGENIQNAIRGGEIAEDYSSKQS